MVYDTGSAELQQSYTSAQAELQQSYTSAQAEPEQSQSTGSAALRVEESRVEESRVEENVRQKMRERFGSFLPDVDGRIADALAYNLNRAPSKQAKNLEQFMRNWLLKDVDRITAMKENTNGRIQHVEPRKLRGAAESWTGWNRKSG